MGAIKENQVFVLGFLLLITIALCIVIVIMSGKIYKNFYVKKFSFTGICEGDGTLNVIISNNTISCSLNASIIFYLLSFHSIHLHIWHALVPRLGLWWDTPFLMYPTDNLLVLSLLA